ncbi:hypothetical protein [Streptomyces sp. NPDC058613]|uniref:hypothetical protein n=1 Tax=unclassified Streptomyces TaxID=2593676 RepID=UPI00364C0223
MFVAQVGRTPGSPVLAHGTERFTSSTLGPVLRAAPRAGAGLGGLPGDLSRNALFDVFFALQAWQRQKQKPARFTRELD